jgi:hypothetical protein
MRKTKAELRDDIAAQIRETPTWSNERISAEVQAPRELVNQVRADMGAKDTWPKKKEH